MKWQSKKIGAAFLIVCSVFLLQACSYRMMDNAVIQKGPQNQQKVKEEIGKKVEGYAYYPYLAGYKLQDAIDSAFVVAGPDYDMLINTTVDVKFYNILVYFSKYVIVKGTAVKSAELKNSMGEAEYQLWLRGQNVVYRAAK